jgi:predicted GH43/DUF377 family glycosyl hydrolase
MAYVSQEKKKELAPSIKQVLKKYGLTGTISVQNYSTLCVKISKGPIDFIKNYQETIAQNPGYDKYGVQDQKITYLDVNTHWIHTNFSGVAEQVLTELKEVLLVGNWDNSDIYTDYFDVGWYIDINIGSWKKPYELVS